MEPLQTTEAVSRRMSRQARRDTKPELELRRLLHARGLRYRVNVPLAGLPRRRSDITFGPAKVVVLVDGCFWHGCPQHATKPATNAEWWAAKLARNIERDRETDAHLEGSGWTVLRFWKHEDMRVAADVVEATVRRQSPRRSTDPGPSPP